MPSWRAAFVVSAAMIAGGWFGPGVLGPASAWAQAAGDALPPPPSETTIQMGGRSYRASLTVISYQPGIVAGGAGSGTTLNIVLTIEPLDGQALPRNFEAKLTLALGRRGLRVPLELRPTITLNAGFGLTFGATLDRDVAAGTITSGRLELSGRRVRGNATLPRVVVGLAGPTV